MIVRLSNICLTTEHLECIVGEKLPQYTCRILCSVVGQAGRRTMDRSATPSRQLCSLRNKKIRKAFGVNERVLVKSKNYQKNIKFRYGNTPLTAWLHRLSRRAAERPQTAPCAQSEKRECATRRRHGTAPRFSVGLQMTEQAVASE
jgi:hypothetical protein